jgi:hypothetical protein
MPKFADWDGTASDHPELFGVIDAIVTGRSWEESQDLYDEAGDLAIPVFFNPVSSKENDARKIVLHKAEIINRCKVERFWEDVPSEYQQLKILCPNCKIILVREGVTAI